MPPAVKRAAKSAPVKAVRAHAAAAEPDPTEEEGFDTEYDKAKKAKKAKKVKDGKAKKAPAEPASAEDVLRHLTGYLENIHERLIGKHEGADVDARTRELWHNYHSAARSVYEPEE